MAAAVATEVVAATAVAAARPSPPPRHRIPLSPSMLGRGEDAVYDREVAHFRSHVNRGNVNLVPKNDCFGYLGRGITHRDEI